MTTFTTSIVEAAATVAAACVKTAIITIAPAVDGVSKQPLKDKQGAQIYSFTVSGAGVNEAADSYQCRPDAKPFVAPTIGVYTAVFTEIHKRLSGLRDGEPVSKIINCQGVK